MNSVIFRANSILDGGIYTIYSGEYSQIWDITVVFRGVNAVLFVSKTFIFGSNTMVVTIPINLYLGQVKYILGEIHWYLGKIQWYSC